MARDAIAITAQPPLTEDGVLTSAAGTSFVFANGWKLQNNGEKGDVLVEIRCVVSRTLRITYTLKGDTFTKDIAMTNGTRRTFRFPSNPFNMHPAGVDPDQVYFDAVAGVDGDFTAFAYRL